MILTFTDDSDDNHDLQCMASQFLRSGFQIHGAAEWRLVQLWGSLFNLCAVRHRVDGMPMPQCHNIEPRRIAASIGVRYLIRGKSECCLGHTESHCFDHCFGSLDLRMMLGKYAFGAFWSRKRYFVAADRECGNLCSGEEFLSPSRYCGGFERTELCDWK